MLFAAKDRWEPAHQKRYHPISQEANLRMVLRISPSNFQVPDNICTGCPPSPMGKALENMLRLSNPRFPMHLLRILHEYHIGVLDYSHNSRQIHHSFAVPKATLFHPSLSEAFQICTHNILPFLVLLPLCTDE